MLENKIGEFREEVVNILGLSIKPGTPIYIGESNLAHMAESHPSDFRKYNGLMNRIITEPDYVGVCDDGSVEYVRSLGQYIKLAVRVAGDGFYYARSLYHVDKGAAERKIRQRKWKRVRLDKQK
jgi:hypothetical protein